MKIKRLIIILISFHMMTQLAALILVKNNLLSINQAFTVLIYVGIIGGLYADFVIEEKEIEDEQEKGRDYTFYQYTKH
ncbi:hypothetical protein [Chengkuizengella axinellae]|uniref:Uncharacterized protein n=1 Tax=Chengkuizengella axinellae TaxID=3064388 RepID=A0ABT9J5D1_9BACL|nr:hypothetical protein [Chengkuizengella sp. 2205SS18-9]MDP5276210.1 hypothetical protein [Chengkuizengella sp. 2205SS18-9]